MIEQTINTVLGRNKDQIFVFTQDFKQVFKNAQVMEVTVYPESELMSHPLENGSVTTDHKITHPIEIELTLVVPTDSYLDVYNQIYDLWTGSLFLNVQTKAAIYKNMVIQNIPHEETSERYDKLLMTLTLQEVLLVEAQYGAAPKVKPSNKKQTPTVDRGQVQAKPATQEEINKAEKSTFEDITKKVLKPNPLPPPG